jgi:hypothetical protein
VRIFVIANESRITNCFQGRSASNSWRLDDSRHFKGYVAAISSDHPLETSADGHYDRHNWALLKLDSRDTAHNIISVPAEGGLKEIFVGSYRTELQDEDDIHFWIITRRGAIPAKSLHSATSVRFPKREEFQNMWSIQLSQNLGKSVSLPTKAC